MTIPLLNVVLLLIFNFFLLRYLRNLFSSTAEEKFNNVQTASVICAVRNEEKQISSLLYSLDHQECSGFTTYITDDYSTDSSFLTIQKLINNKNGFRLLKNDLNPGKKYALTKGIQASEGEIIMITDADCRPSAGWTELFLRKFSEGYDFVFGIAPITTNNTLVSKISGFENLRGFILSAAAAKAGFPYSAAARSFGFRRRAFEKIQGYRNTMEVPFGDDGLLIREAVRNNMKIGVVVSPDAFVYTDPGKNFKEYFKQRKRHITTSFYYLPKIKFLLSVWHLLNLAPFLMLLFVPVSILFLLPLIVKIFSDIIIVLKYQAKFGYKFRTGEIFYLQLLFEIFVIVHFFNALTGNIKWKDI